MLWPHPPHAVGYCNAKYCATTSGTANSRYLYTVISIMQARRAINDVHFFPEEPCRLLETSACACIAGPRKADSAGGIDWFVHNPVLVAAAGRSASEFWKDAERHLKTALASQPAAANLLYTLVQVVLLRTMPIDIIITSVADCVMVIVCLCISILLS